MRELQARLNTWIKLQNEQSETKLEPLAVDGHFGPKTLARLAQFQEAHDILTRDQKKWWTGEAEQRTIDTLLAYEPTDFTLKGRKGRRDHS